MLKINDNVTITVGGERLEVVGSEFAPIDIPRKEKVAFIVSREKFDLYAAAPDLLTALEYCAANSADIDLDYIDGDKGNNAPDNLEYVSQRENVHRLHSLRGKPVGVYFCKKTTRYNAQISKGKDKITLGWFKTEDEASAAYKAARKVIEKWID